MCLGWGDRGRLLKASSVDKQEIEVILQQFAVGDMNIQIVPFQFGHLNPLATNTDYS